MGDWADMHDYGYDLSDQINHKAIRHSLWTCRDGTQIAIYDMTDSHLLNAYKMFGSETLFREMVVRLFEQKVRGDK
jgi:hypothetical protein